MAKKIAVVYGGWSSEAKISRKSAEAVVAALRRLGYEVIQLELSRRIALDLERIKPDLVFPVLHGKPGEDGSFQGLLEILGIPFVGEGQKVCALCIDKDLTKKVLLASGVPTARWTAVRRGDPPPRWDLFPAVLKPSEEGSSIGLKVVKDKKELQKTLKELLDRFEKVLVEEFLPGGEFTVGFVKGRFFTPLEIRPRGGIYDYETKYSSGGASFIPVRDGRLKNKLTELAKKTVEAIGIRELARIDLKCDAGGEPRVLEVNTIPGMTPTSLLPKMASEDGLNFDELVKVLLQGKES